MPSDWDRPSRRDLLTGTAAGAAVLSSTGAAAFLPQTRSEFPAKGRAVRGPGIPVPSAVVPTRSGPVQGLVEDGVHTFRGIRYGKAPVGPLRFMPPEPPEPWTTPWDATDYGAPSMQMASGATATTTSDYGLQMHRVFSTPSHMKVMNEDCLFLNVWTPGTDARARPVMVWFHGGGFAYGSGSDPVYQGDGLAKWGDVVVVSVNHRLNIFGYLQLGELMGPAYKASGTVGMQDLVLSLRWVRDNIAGFGGDPGNVTIMGQSGGGAKVSALMAMPSAAGLFHKASVQSGPGLTLGRPAPAAAAARRLLDAVGVKPGDARALQAVPAQTLLAAAMKLGSGPGGAGPGSGPVVDGTVIPRDPFTPDAPAVSADVPLMIGWCKDEWTIFTVSEPWFGTMTEEQLQARVAPLGAPGQQLLAAFRRAYPDYSPTYLWEQMISARVMQGTELLAERKAAQGRAPVFVWWMTWDNPQAGGVYKTPHTMEIPFMLRSFDKVPAFTGSGPQVERLADLIAGAWVQFARTGRPGTRGMPAWPPFDARSRQVMELNLRPRVVSDPLPEVRRALAAIPPNAIPRS